MEQAEQYFAERMKKIFLLSRYSGEIINFYPHRMNSAGGYCYFLSMTALMGLKKDDVRRCGTIDTVPQFGYRATRDYRHAWVEFETNGEIFVYDSLLDHIVPKDVYYDISNPRKVTSEMTLGEILDLYLANDYAYGITDRIWQFKASEDVVGYNGADDGHIFDALQKGHLVGCFKDGSCNVSMFVADEPRFYY